MSFILVITVYMSCPEMRGYMKTAEMILMKDQPY